MPKTEIKNRTPRTWVQLTINAPVRQADLIAAFLASVPVDGVEQTAPPPDGETPIREDINCYLTPGPEFEARHEEIKEFVKRFNNLLPKIEQINCRYSKVIEEDWNAGWKEHFKPFKLSERLVIKPTWVNFKAQGAELVIEMDPGMAFGTGLHATTRLTVRLMEKLFAGCKPPNTVLDVGCGTGILGMSCVLFGAGKVIGVDNDPDAREAARANIAHNGLLNYSIIDDDLKDVGGEYDLIAANITCDILTMLVPDLVRCLAAGGDMVLSGILAGDQSDAIEKNLNNRGLTLVELCRDDEWVGMHFSAAR
ncbi:50S ribosomal protein L11 methyltransferase [Desulfobacterota bacterium M19]